MDFINPLFNLDVANANSGEGWTAWNSDCVPVAANLPDHCVDLSIYSPPFANLYTYSADPADMGNCSTQDEFFEQYQYLLAEMARITKPGRMSCVHCMDIPTKKFSDGYIGLTDFPGSIIAAHINAGFIYHSRVTIWKDPVVEMQRTKSLGLLHKQLKKDSCMSRAGLPDYLLVFRAPGDNLTPVTHSDGSFPVGQWQQWASPVWMDVNQTDTLNVAQARNDRDEKHICPLQKDVILRALTLYSNREDVVFSPFMGIGSEGYHSLLTGRRFIGTELKPEYFREAVANLKSAEEIVSQELFR